MKKMWGWRARAASMWRRSISYEQATLATCPVRATNIGRLK